MEKKEGGYAKTQQHPNRHEIILDGIAVNFKFDFLHGRGLLIFLAVALTEQLSFYIAFHSFATAFHWERLPLGGVEFLAILYATNGGAQSSRG